MYLPDILVRFDFWFFGRDNFLVRFNLNFFGTGTLHSWATIPSLDLIIGFLSFSLVADMPEIAMKNSSHEKNFMAVTQQMAFFSEKYLRFLWFSSFDCLHFTKVTDCCWVETWKSKQKQTYSLGTFSKIHATPGYWKNFYLEISCTKQISDSLFLFYNALPGA